MKLSEIVNIFDEGMEQFGDEAEFVNMGEDLVILYKPFVKVESIVGPLYVSEGVYCNKGEDGYEADWSLTWVWQNESNPEDYLYYESDGISVSLHNLFPNETINEWEAEFVE